MGRKDVEEVEKEEIQELLTDFEAVWQRVSSPQEAQNTAPLPAPPRIHPEPQSGRVPRWFCEI